MLVVEDEMMLRMRSVDIVEAAGYTPVEAVDADQAFCDRDPNCVAVSPTSRCMDGLELAHAAHECWPQLKIILVSGQLKLSCAEFRATAGSSASRWYRAKSSRNAGHDRTRLILAGNGPRCARRGAATALRPKDMPGTRLSVLSLPMLKSNHDREALDLVSGSSLAQDQLTAENVSLRLLLTQANLSVETLVEQAGVDAKAREAADRLQKLILEELHHRIKNTLATVSAIASQSLRNAASTELAQQAIEGRLLALGRAHDLLLQARWTSADMRKIIRGAIEPFDNPDLAKFSIEGPDVQIASGAVIAIAMTLNELCTNTTKFGALSVPDGRVAISWVVDENKRVQFIWQEHGGPTVQAPTRRSFGTRLIETLGSQLRGNVKLAYEQSGFVYKLDVPLASLEFSTIE